MTKSGTAQVSQQDGVTIISLGAEYENLDESVLNELKDVLLNVAETADPATVVLDLSETKFFCSAFIEVMFRIWNRLNRREGGRFCISGLTGHCQEVLAVTHLDRLWEIFPTREEAVRALSGT